MQKVAGVTSVTVSLNEGLTTLELVPENSVTLANLRQIIRNNGFVTNESKVIARGTVSSSGSGLILEVRGSKERLTLTAPANTAAFDQLRSRVESRPADIVIAGVAGTRDPKAFTLSVERVIEG